MTYYLGEITKIMHLFLVFFQETSDFILHDHCRIPSNLIVLNWEEMNLCTCSAKTRVICTCSAKTRVILSYIKDMESVSHLSDFLHYKIRVSLTRIPCLETRKNHSQELTDSVSCSEPPGFLKTRVVKTRIPCQSRVLSSRIPPLNFVRDNKVRKISYNLV